MTNDNESARAQYVKMTETPINKLIASLAVPTVISMLITMIYNVADTYFVSKISISASGATGIVFSLMGILQAFGFMFGQGAGSNISRRLGAKDIDTARKYCSTAFALALISGLVIMVLGLTFLEPLMNLLGSTDTILPYSKAYGIFILISAPAMTTSCVMNNILRYEGMANLAMVGLTAGGVLNIILDPILIFVFNLDISGAGIATAVSQYISMILLLIVFVSKKPQSRISFKYIYFKPRFIWDIVSTGVPSFARQGLNSLSTMFLNIEAAIYGDACIAAMSIVAKCANLIFSVGVGIGQGFQPVSSFNYGAKKYNRVREGIKFVWKFDTLVVAVLSAIMFVFDEQVVCIFRDDAEVIEVGVAALRYICIALLFLPTVMTANMTFQSVGKTGRAFFLACTQNGLFFIPLVLILPKVIGISGIELAQPISYVIAALIAVPFLLSFMKKLKKEDISD
ncbi:MAG: MATE family efflux transporter [Eubacterium sp.]